LFDTNYIAHDIRSGTNVYAKHYDSQSKELFVQRYNQLLEKFDADKDVVSKIFLDIYANSVDNLNRNGAFNIF